MGASIQINGAPSGSKNVPFGAQVSMLNADTVGTVNQVWEILNYPTALTTPSEPDAGNFPGWTFNPVTKIYTLTQAFVDLAVPVTFFPDVTGNYLIRLTSFETDGSQKVDSVVAIVPEAFTEEVIPAAGQTREADTFRGWASNRNHTTKALGRRQAKGVYLMCVNLSGVGIVRGRVCRIVGVVDAHTVPPNVLPPFLGTAKAEQVVSIELGDPSGTGADQAQYVVADEDIADGEFGWGQSAGVFEGQADVNYSAAFTTDQVIYMGPGGIQQTVATAIRIGSVIDAGAGNAAMLSILGVDMEDTAQIKFSGILFGAVGLVTRYLADTGADLATSHELAVAHNYIFCDDRAVTCVKVHVNENTLITDSLLTLMVNGLPSSLQVVLPALTTGPFTAFGVVDLQDDDRIDLRLENTAGGGGNGISLSVTLIHTPPRPLVEDFDMSLDENREAQTTPGSVAEEILYEYRKNFDNMVGVVNIYASLDAIGRVEGPGPAVGTYNVRVGGTIGNPLDGAVLATATTNSTSDTGISAVGGAIPRPVGVQSVKITGKTSDGAFPAHLRGMDVFFGRA